MVFILSWCLWLTFTLARSSSPEGVSAFEKRPRHDKSWWLWNLEAKEKPLIPGTLEKEDKDNHKLVYERSALRGGPVLSPPNLDDLRRHRQVRWLPSGFGFGSKKNQPKESRKWWIEGESSGANTLSGTKVIQDPWIKKMKHRSFSGIQHSRKSSRGHFKKRIHPGLQQTDPDRRPNAENILFSSSNLTDHMRSLPKNLNQNPRPTYGDLKPLSSIAPFNWNKSHDPIWDRYMTPFPELKFNPLRRPYPFHDPRYSIPWYTIPWQHKPKEPTRKHVPGQNHQNDVGEVVGKEVAKPKSKESRKQRLRGYTPLEEFELIPKVYALNRLRNNKYHQINKYGWFPETVTNPIIVPGFKRKYVDVPPTEDETRRPYIVKAKQPDGAFDEFVQVSRGNRNQTKVSEPAANDPKLTLNGPLQLPSPYGFPGGVNISILVPPAPSQSHEVSVATTAMSTTSKKKKERKKKVKDDDSLQDNVLSAPRAQVTPLARRKPTAGLQLIKLRPQNSMADAKYSVFDIKTDNFGLLNHVRNLSFDKVNWDKLVLGMQPENGNKHDEDDDDDEIRMLYDEQTSSTASPLSTDQLVTDRTVSFEWYRFTDYASRSPNVLRGGKLRIPSLIEPEFRKDPTSSDKIMRSKPYSRSENARKTLSGERNENWSLNDHSHCQSRHHVEGDSRDQWDALDEDLKNIVNGKNDEVVWQLKNWKREADYRILDDAEGYYRLSSGESPLRNPSHLIMSAFRRKSGKRRDGDYYDDIPEDRIQGRVRNGEQIILNTE